MDDDSVRGRSRRIRLSDMTAWVLVAAVFFTMVRGATGFWGNPVPALNIDRVVGVVLLAIAATVVGRLVAKAISRERTTGFGRTWRGLGAALLIGLAFAESAVLRVDGRSKGFVLVNMDAWPPKLAALATSIGLIGVLLGLVPYRRSRPGRRRWGAANVVFAGLAGLLILTAFELMIPYLVLIAIDAVQLAIRRSALIDARVRGLGHMIDPVFLDRSLWPSVNDRLIESGIGAAIALFACGLTAHWLGRDLRGEGIDVDSRRSRAAISYRAATAFATWVMGVYLLFVGLPRLQPWLAEGLWNVLGPIRAGAIAVSFLALSAGIAARGLAGPAEAARAVDPSPGSRYKRLVFAAFKVMFIALLTMVILAAVSKIRGDERLPTYVPFPLRKMLTTADGMLTIATPTAIYFDPGKEPEVVFLLGAVVIVLALLRRYLIGSSTEAPVDRIGRNPRRIGRFLGAWLALGGVMFTLFPSFVLAGLALIHFALKWLPA